MLCTTQEIDIGDQWSEGAQNEDGKRNPKELILCNTIITAIDLPLSVKHWLAIALEVLNQFLVAKRRQQICDIKFLPLARLLYDFIKLIEMAKIYMFLNFCHDTLFKKNTVVQ